MISLARLATFAAILSGIGPHAEAQEPQAQYKLSVTENIIRPQKTKDGKLATRVTVLVSAASGEPVGGIPVTFVIPQVAGGGATFENGTLTSLSTTNDRGVAASEAFDLAPGEKFTMSVSATVQGSGLSLLAPVGGEPTEAPKPGSPKPVTPVKKPGMSSGAKIGLVAAAAGGGIAAAVLGAGGGKGGGGGGGGGTTVTTPRGTISGPGVPVFGPPR